MAPETAPSPVADEKYDCDKIAADFKKDLEMMTDTFSIFSKNYSDYSDRTSNYRIANFLYLNFGGLVYSHFLKVRGEMLLRLYEIVADFFSRNRVPQKIIEIFFGMVESRLSVTAIEKLRKDAAETAAQLTGDNTENE